MIKIKIVDIKRKEYRLHKKKTPDSMDLRDSDLYAENNNQAMSKIFTMIDDSEDRDATNCTR